MTHYQRVIVKVQGRQEINKLFLELPEEKDANAIETGSYSGWSNPYAFTITAKASNKDGQAIANKTMTWESSDEAVGTISSKGVFTPKKAGRTWRRSVKKPEICWRKPRFIRQLLKNRHSI